MNFGRDSLCTEKLTWNMIFRRWQRLLHLAETRHRRAKVTPDNDESI